MYWKEIIFDAAQSETELPGKIDLLLENQRASWPLLREGEELLAQMLSKILYQKQSHVIVQSNPARRKSTQAKVDPISISTRPCFLCVENLPKEERGIAFDRFVLLPNPYPILPRHLTIPIREHRPQRLEGQIENMLKLTRALGPEMLVYYNGARCGASAPDHFHFQACSCHGVPLLVDLAFIEGENKNIPYESFGRRMLVCSEKNAVRVCTFLCRALEVLSDLKSDKVEPMVNIVSIFRNNRYLIILFPRAKHRPACFFAEGDAQISISPAALEMAGILVVADPAHFHRVDKKTAISIYEQVTIADHQFNQLVEAFK